MRRPPLRAWLHGAALALAGFCRWLGEALCDLVEDDYGRDRDRDRDRERDRERRR